MGAAIAAGKRVVELTAARVHNRTDNAVGQRDIPCRACGILPLRMRVGRSLGHYRALIRGLQTMVRSLIYKTRRHVRVPENLRS